jgi:alpha-tubulin suppressor-like RCC1 family protein
MRIRRLDVPFVPLLLAAAAAAQSSVRGWGPVVWDTDSRLGAAMSVTALEGHTAIVRTDGRVFIQGSDQLGVCNPPASVMTVPFAKVMASYRFASALRFDGSIVVWGDAPIGPAPALPAGVVYTQFSQAESHIIALRSDGGLALWGVPGTAVSHLTMPSLPPGVPITKVGAGYLFNVVRLANGTIHAWGDNALGQCNVPQLPPGVTYVDFDTGFEHTLAIRSDGQAVAWGENSDGECNVPPLPPGLVYQFGSCGSAHTNAMRSDGVVLSWGWNGWGLLDVPEVPAGTSIVSLDSGSGHTVALLSDGKMLFWGNIQDLATVPEGPAGQLRWHFAHVSKGSGFASTLVVSSHGRVHNLQSPVPPIPNLGPDRFVKVEEGFMHRMALRSDGAIIAWANGLYGPNPHGTLNVPPLPPGVVYKDVVCGWNHSVALRSDGNAVAWGEIGTGACTIPPPPAGQSYVGIGASSGGTTLLRSDHAIVYAGSMVAGHQSSQPALPTGVRWVRIVHNNLYMAGLRSDGQVVLWGPGSMSGPTWRPVPPLPFGTNYVDLSAGIDYVAWRRSDGAVGACGRVSYREDIVPPLAPGTSYLRLGGRCAIVGPESTYVSFAPGCAGSHPPARLVPRDTPFVGHRLEVEVFHLPANIALMTMGWQQLASPVSLAAVGMPGCFQQISVDAAAAIVGQANSAVWNLPIPDLPDLVGVTFYNQALVLDPAAPNALGAVVSDAAKAVVGRL